jgi:UDP-N-acetylglucosamine--N-acetylmuramyl-(pentapeptide) pyrophosphoryl-undecaprenol N-acetylglucosamine transferase
MGLPSILIPSPNVTDNHQYFNAKAFSDANAAVLIKEDDFSADSLSSALSEIFGKKNNLSKMSKASKALAKPEALKIIVDEIEKLL